jgi:hypothetical protein
MSTVLHASGFADAGEVRGVRMTTYEGTIREVAVAVLSECERHGHSVSATWTTPLGSNEVIHADATVIVLKDGAPLGTMWHAFGYASDPWPTATPKPCTCGVAFGTAEGPCVCEAEADRG